MAWTIDQFQTERFELPEGGRWCELIAGEPVQYSPPDPRHGNVILNLSKRLAIYRQQTDWSGATCFELGIVTSRNPDTLLVPAVSMFANVGPFEFADESLTDKSPQWVIEVASSQDRKDTLSGKRHQYRLHGIEQVWVIETAGESVMVFSPDGREKRFSAAETICVEEILPGLTVSVGDLFRDPEWWS